MSRGITSLFLKLGFTLWFLYLMREVNGKQHRPQCRSEIFTEEKDLVMFQEVQLRFLGQLARSLASVRVMTFRLPLI